MSKEIVIKTQAQVIKTKVQTVFLLIGPSYSGKSTFARYAKGLLRRNLVENVGVDGYEPVIHIISSDDIRRELWGDSNLHKYDDKMVHASNAAFKVLGQKLEQAMSYPFNSEFIFIDSTGLDPEFRKAIQEICDKNSYRVELVVFNYPELDDYLLGLSEEQKDYRTVSVVAKHVRRLREQFKYLKFKDYDGATRILSKRDIAKIEFDIDVSEYKKTLVPDHWDEIEFIGDVQGCFSTLLTLLEKLGFSFDPKTFKLSGPETTLLVFLGDLINKGPRSAEVLRLVRANEDICRMILGNHENFTYKYFSGKLKDTVLPPKEVMDNYFTTVKEFTGDFKAIEDLTYVVENMATPFLKGRLFIATHSPCRTESLGRVEGPARRAQINFRKAPRRTDGQTVEEHGKELEKSLEFLRKEAQRNQPFHIFGHVMTKSPFIYKNKVGTDTGAVAGNLLTSFRLDRYKKGRFTTVPVVEGEALRPEELPALFVKEPYIGTVKNKVDLDDLDFEERRRMNRMAYRGINFVSGTMSPSGVDKELNRLETVNTALDYFESKGVERVIVQPKYMGSRAQIYLNAEKPVEDSGEDMLVTRNGYNAKWLKLDEFYDRLRFQHKELFETLNASMIIFDGEFLPWSAIGQGLINDIYHATEVGIGTEIERLEALGFEKALEELRADAEPWKQAMNSMKAKEFRAEVGLTRPGFEEAFQSHLKTSLEDSREVTEEEIEAMRRAYAERLGTSYATNYSKLREVRVIPLDEQKRMHAIYKQQVEVFGKPVDFESDEPYTFKAFSILKVIHKDGTETSFISPEHKNSEIFPAINTDSFLLVDLKDPDSRVEANLFFDQLSDEEMEGVVVKPDVTLPPEGVAPYLKVRTPNYLSIIYGYDYQHPSRFEDQIASRSIRRKLELSIKEYELGKRLLDIPRHEISKENEHYLSLLKQLILEERKERELDPRL